MPDALSCLEDPAWFLADVDPATGALQFIQTRAQIVAEAAFLDGRAPIAVAPGTQTVALDAALAWQARARDRTPPVRLVAHISFCGSTLLSRLLQGDGRVLAYREPHALSHLANLKAAGTGLCQHPARWRALVGLVLGQYTKSWTSEPAIVKPSNWVNTLLADMHAACPDLRWAVIDTDVEDFLIANLRGGKARLAYSLNLLNHFLTANQVYRGDVLDVERGGLSPTQRLLRLLVLNYETQQGLLAGAAPGPAPVRVSLSALQNDPATTVATVAEALDLALSDSEITAAITRDMARHAKADAEPFVPDRQAAENDRLRRDFEDEIDAALAWRKTILRDAA